MNHTIHSAATIAALVLLFVPGCGRRDGPELAGVSGTVTLDGSPLPKARIEFQPRQAGSPSMAVTDAAGRYRLVYSVGRYGAIPGRHTVRISTYRQVSSSQGRPREAIPERVPSRYNDETELVREVKPGSENVIDFHLEGALESPEP